jgi:signal transduction protein with GAF and PtsI domain
MEVKQHNRKKIFSGCELVCSLLYLIIGKSPILFYLPQTKEGGMRKEIMNYENLVRITKAIAHCRDPEDVALMSVEAVKTGLGVKGCALLLIDRRSKELKVAGSYGLSEDYLNKGPVSSLKSMAASLEEGPVAVSDVTDDPRIQYPEEAQKEGIASILSVPIQLQQRSIGALRVYTSEPWDFTLEDINFVQAIAQIIGVSVEMSRMYKGYKEAISVLKEFREVSKSSRTRRTPYEGVPVSVPRDEMERGTS